jgi:antitoxin YefM
MLLTKRTEIRTIYPEDIMPVIKATDARSKLYRLIDEVSSSHNPVTITGKRGNAVLLSEEDWKAIQETLFLLSIPGMRESIRTGLETPVEECAEELDW